jgi:DNA topoisomerase-1
MPDATHVLAGECTIVEIETPNGHDDGRVVAIDGGAATAGQQAVTETGPGTGSGPSDSSTGTDLPAPVADQTTHRGRVVVVVKPDNTVLVHDADGYRPVAWLTRAESVSFDRQDSADGFTVTAHTADRRLRVSAETTFGFGRYPSSTAGAPVGDCPDCGEALVHRGGDVRCLGCEERYGLPAGAALDAGTCECGLPRMRVERGEPFDLCIDRSCESLDVAVRERFDRVWDCPECGDDLRILRKGGLLAGCDSYPDCEVGFAFPDGLLTGTCDCDLPAFETASGRRCLDPTCQG